MAALVWIREIIAFRIRLVRWTTRRKRSSDSAPRMTASFLSTCRMALMRKRKHSMAVWLQNSFKQSRMNSSALSKGQNSLTSAARFLVSYWTTRITHKIRLMSIRKHSNSIWMNQRSKTASRKIWRRMVQVSWTMISSTTCRSAWIRTLILAQKARTSSRCRLRSTRTSWLRSTQKVLVILAISRRFTMRCRMS